MRKGACLNVDNFISFRVNQSAPSKTLGKSSIGDSTEICKRGVKMA